MEEWYVMIYAERGKEKDIFILFVEDALEILSLENYSGFLALFDSSRLQEKELILALKYLDETQPVLKIDNPKTTVSDDIRCDLICFKDQSVYTMDYDLTTDGVRNDLTIQIEFRLSGTGYKVILHDLHTL